MRVRFCLSLIAVCSMWAVGCQPPDAEFVSNDRIQELAADARQPIQQTIEAGFGTPKDLVAWMGLSVDFGELNGVVAETPEAGSAHRIQVDFELSPEEVEQQAGADIRKTALLWKTGAYAGASLPVADYDPETNTLTLGQNMEPPPQAGDQFVVVGHSLRQGRKLYMRHCMHCHGVTGDGAGPTAKYLNPLPRDYRLGLFKFTSTLRPEKATTDDLKRIVKLGIPGTYMPSFMLLKDQEIAALVEYVRWLAIRGEMEDKLITELAADFSTAAFNQRIEEMETINDQQEEEYDKQYDEWKKNEQGPEPEEPEEVDAEDVILKELQAFLDQYYQELVDQWSTDIPTAWNHANEAVIHPKKKRTPPTVESIARGRKLFLGPKAKCASCHGATGLGNGPQTEDFQKIPGKEEKFTERGLHDNWGHIVKPRNLTRGIYRGGRRPLDLYRRVHSGIKGTPMAGFATALSEEEMWDIVNYVLSVPFEKSSAKASPPVASQNKSKKVAALPHSGSR